MKYECKLMKNDQLSKYSWLLQTIMNDFERREKKPCDACGGERRGNRKKRKRERERTKKGCLYIKFTHEVEKAGKKQRELAIRVF